SAMKPSLGPNVELLSAIYQNKIGDSTRVTAVIGGMGTLALLLATVGLYGVVAYGVARRTREVGIRMALGATSIGIVRNMVANFVLPIGLAIAIGLGLAAVLSTALRSIHYGLSNWDPVSFALAALLLAAVAGLAALVPARRALKVDPMVALRCE